MTKEKFLLDTLQYFTAHPSRRCMNESGTRCAYSPETVGLESISEGCAIGRHMTPENKLKADRKLTDLADLLHCNPELFPEWMIPWGSNFLKKVQNLHDHSTNWNARGLTGKGKNELQSIIVIYQIPSDKFMDYLKN